MFSASVTSTISWWSKKQRAAALSSTDTDYRAAVIVACEVIWLRRILVDLNVEQIDPTRLHATCEIFHEAGKNLIFHEQTNPVEVQCHCI
jgi:hypothetical protein